jgi:hypothetical protein
MRGGGPCDDINDYNQKMKCIQKEISAKQNPCITSRFSQECRQYLANKPSAGR